jgi:hypothetical protein
MPKFYQYIIYKIYTWRLDKNDDTPVATVILLLSMVHIFYLVMIYFIVIDLLGVSMDLIKPRSFLAAAILLLFMGLNYLVFYNKKAWDRYIERFKDETEEQRSRGNFGGYCLLRRFCVIIFYRDYHILYARKTIIETKC